MQKYSNVVILTGAGISAESGVSTFRDAGGIWQKYDYKKVSTPDGFRANPDLVHDFYNMRRTGLAKYNPNQAHTAVARLERKFDGSVLVVTQNVDDLHERAGTQNLIHMHGQLYEVKCKVCGKVTKTASEIGRQTVCSHCGVPGGLRPNVVWFGEVPMFMDTIYSALAKCDLFVSIGTSGTVYPAAGFVQEVRSHGRAHTLEINLEPSEGVSLFHEVRHGSASQLVPEFVSQLLDNAQINWGKAASWLS